MVCIKIAMIGHKCVPSRLGGVEIVVEQLARHMASAGHTVCLYNRSTAARPPRGCKGPNPKEYAGARLIWVPTLPIKGADVAIYSFLATLHALFCRYDVIHYHAQGPCYMLWLPRLLGIPTVATIHGLDWQRAKWGGLATRFLKWGEAVAARYASEIVVLSRSMQRYFWRTYGRGTHYIPNGAAAQSKVPCAQDTAALLARYNLVPGGYILFLARLVPEKGLHYLLAAYSGLHTAKKLVVAGGQSGAPAYAKAQFQYAKGIPGVLFTGHVQGPLQQCLYANAYLYVLPSDVEGMPLTLLEAMGYGRCCVVSNIAENLEVVTPAGEGCAAVPFQKANSRDLCAKMSFLLRNPRVVSAVGKRAARHVKRRYSWPKTTAQTLAVYQRAKMPKKQKG